MVFKNFNYMLIILYYYFSFLDFEKGLIIVGGVFKVM